MGVVGVVMVVIGGEGKGCDRGRGGRSEGCGWLVGS